MSTSDGDIYVDYGRVADVEDVLKACDAAVGQVLNEVQAGVGPLISSWQGSSQDVCQQIQTKWNADTMDMQNILSQYAPALEEMRINYGTTDNDLALQWSAIH